MIVLEQARQHPQTLGLKEAMEVLNQTLDAADNQHLPYPETLAQLLGIEVSARGEWGELLGDTVIASAVLDRLLHHSHVLSIRGESLRLREKRQAGLFLSQHLNAAPEEACNNYTGSPTR